MIYDVEAVYDQGIFRPVTPLGLAEGARVHLRVEEENGECGKASKPIASYEA
jgi:predicted DNA-binding antitoxin AbrB/MazE fold protein